MEVRRRVDSALGSTEEAFVGVLDRRVALLLLLLMLLARRRGRGVGVEARLGSVGGRRMRSAGSSFVGEGDKPRGAGELSERLGGGIPR